jgi:transcriptional regulator with XRE-family HTH domain
VRERRIELGLSQPELAAELGITFQGLYKYEKGKNRISASRLYGLSKALGVPVTFFFEGIAETEAKAQKPKGRKTWNAAPERSKRMDLILIILIILLLFGGGFGYRRYGYGGGMGIGGLLLLVLLLYLIFGHGRV